MKVAMGIGIFIVLCALCMFGVSNAKEPFWFIPVGISICRNTANMTRHQCKRCTNAGYCTLSNGQSMCVPGDQNGPYNGDQCVFYEYGTDYNSLSLVDPPQPYWSEPHKRWHWNKSHERLM
jgi:hypothetical protein